MIDQAGEIWNRALDPAFEPQREGDKVLSTVLAFHGLVMNGGLDYALDADYALACDAAEGFRRLDAGDLAQLTTRACEVVSRLADDAGEVEILEATQDELLQIQTLGARYADLLPSDDHLEQIFRRYLANNPDDFEPLTHNDAR